MLLLIDVGNTRVKWALAEIAAPAGVALGRWTSSGSVAHADLASLAETWQGQEISRVLLSNVAGNTMRGKLEEMLRHLNPAPIAVEWFASQPQMAGVRNGYRNPAQLGCDRFASLIGAHALFPGQPLIVATCGTATTVDALSADGLFLGGMILPGLGLMASSLARNTAQLPLVAQDIVVAQTFADNTGGAIVSGCIAAQAGAIERAVATHKRQAATAAATAPVRCILSGGAAVYVAPHLSIPHQIVENLVLTGLHTVAVHHQA